MRAHIQQTAEGDFLRTSAAAAVRNRAPVRHAGAASADSAAKDASQYRGLGTAAVPRARSVEDGAAVLAPVDARAHEPARRAQARTRAAPGYHRGFEAAAAAVSNRGARGIGRPLARAGGVPVHRGIAPRNAAFQLSPGYRHYGRFSVAVRIGVCGLARAAPLVRVGADGRGRRFVHLVSGVEVATRMRIPVESSTSYRGRNSRPNWLALLGFVGLAFAAGALGAIFAPSGSAKAAAWYALLAKPAWAPPNRWFAAVWTLLYPLMGT